MASLVRCATRVTLLNRGGLSKLFNKQLPCTQQVAHISSKVLRDLNGVQRPPPYDYRNKDYTLINSWFDKTTSRLDENSKIILVEGPIAAGKTAFAKQLAEDLDMYHLPQATMDDVYINAYGYDLRDLDPKLPPGARTFDENKFVNDPKNRLTAAFQLQMYCLKFRDYITALGHLLSTGQGVVLERSPFSDIVFVEALYRSNLISKSSYKGILETRQNSLPELLKPHLVIYLDVPVNATLDNIKKRNKYNEANSSLFKDTKFLETMDSVYKRDFLKNISNSSELLVYDWSNGGETELVVEDIERIDFDSYEKEDSKMKDWRFIRVEPDWAEARMKYTTDRDDTYSFTDLPLYHCPDLCIEPEDSAERFRIYEDAKSFKYAYGYNADLGDKDILTKTKSFNPPKRKDFNY